jgi:hypothetical protein
MRVNVAGEVATMIPESTNRHDSEGKGYGTGRKLTTKRPKTNRAASKKRGR